MSREIKFRAWDKKAKEYFHISVLWNSGTNPECFNFDGWTDNFGNKVRLKDIAIEQYTGLKDKNGKKIYEGDIVQFHGNSDDLAIVKFGEFGVPEIDTEKYVDMAIGFYYEPKGSLSNIAPFNMTVPLNKSYANLGEIIGNIHENPELLEADKWPRNHTQNANN